MCFNYFQNLHKSSRRMQSDYLRLLFDAQQRPFVLDLLVRVGEMVGAV